MSQHNIGVLSTINVSGQPESAVVGFAETPELWLIFGTSVKSRKAGNILVHPEVAFVVGWDSNSTVQYQGIAELLQGNNLK